LDRLKIALLESFIKHRTFDRDVHIIDPRLSHQHGPDHRLFGLDICGGGTLFIYIHHDKNFGFDNFLK
jgi:hypothetical protein